jgi:hypothetical protein
MKVALSEKQLKLITSMTEADSDTSASSGTDSGTSNAASSSQSSKGGYPAVDKWESGITRGPANPIGITKWSDVVGAKLTRGHANPLNEQDAITNNLRNYAIYDALKNDTPYIEVPAFYGGNIRIPKDSEASIKYFKDDDNLVLRFADKQRGPNGELLWSGEPAPSEADLKQKLPLNTLRSFKTKKDGYFYSIMLQKDGDKNSPWSPYKNYYATVNNKNIPYNPNNYINYSTSTNVLEFLNEHGQLIAQITLSIAAAMATGGMSLTIQCIAQAAVQIPFSIIDFKEGRNIGGVMSLAICFLPLAGRALSIGTKFNMKVMNQLANDIKPCTTIQEIENVIKNAKLDKASEVVLSRILKQTPEEFGKLIGTGLLKGFQEGVKNGTIVLEKIPSGQLMWWKRLLIEGGTGMVGMVGASFADNIILSAKQRDELINHVKNLTSNRNKKYAEQDKINNNKEQENYDKKLIDDGEKAIQNLFSELK